MSKFTGSAQSARLPWTLTAYCLSRSVDAPKCLHSTSSRAFSGPNRILRYPRWVNAPGARSRAAAAASKQAIKETGSADSAIVSIQGDADAKPSSGSSESDSDDPDGSSSGSSSSSSSSSSDEPPDDNSSSKPPQGSDSPPPSSSSGAISKQSVPEVYPQVMALPITRRPLFPGFYKAVVVKDRSVVAAIKEMMKRGQPYIGAFLLKDENADSDIITDVESIHRVGVFAQITSIFPANQSSSTLKDEEKDESLTVVLYPHRRIRINDLLPIRGSSRAKLEEITDTEGKQDEASAGRKEEAFSPRTPRSYEWGTTLMDPMLQILSRPLSCMITPSPSST